MPSCLRNRCDSRDGDRRHFRGDFVDAGRVLQIRGNQLAGGKDALVDGCVLGLGCAIGAQAGQKDILEAIEGQIDREIVVLGRQALDLDEKLQHFVEERARPFPG